MNVFRKLLSFGLVVIFSIQLVSAQYSTPTTTKNKKAIEYYMQAQEMMARKMYPEALYTLDEALKKDENFTEAYATKAGIYYAMKDFVPAKKNFQKALSLNPPADMAAGMSYNMADIAMVEGDYGTALSYYKAFKDNRPKRPTMIAKADKDIANCNFAIEAQKKPLPFNPEALSADVNRYYLQYFPSVTADDQTMIFTNLKEQRGDEDLIECTKTNGIWANPHPVSENINTKNNEGAASISGDGKSLVFTSCNRQDGFGSCDLYVSYKEGVEWSKPKNMGNQINTNSWESQPSLSVDGRTLYFVSSRRGGFGTEDIYVSRLDTAGVWSRPANLGKKINTTERDLTPYIHPNGKTLYFSSAGHVGMGGYDMYYTTMTDTGWTEPVNLGYPLNTHRDEMGFILSGDDKTGYYSLEEKKDTKYTSLIYQFDVPEEIKPKFKVTYAKGTVYDADTKKPLGGKIDLIDLKSGKVVQSTLSDKINGSYLITLTEGSEYALYVSSEGYLFKSLSFNYLNKASFDPLTLDVYLQPIKAGAMIVLNNIFFESGKYELLPKSLTELNKVAKFLKENPNVKVEISGHTDDIGKDADNLVLSNNRAKAVYDYLIKSGVNKLSLTFKGYGETKPAVANTSDENRQQNRRIEFKLL